MNDDVLDFGESLVSARPELLLAARRLTSTTEDAARLVRVTLDKAWRSRRQFNAGERLGAWLTSILRSQSCGGAPIRRRP